MASGPDFRHVLPKLQKADSFYIQDSTHRMILELSISFFKVDVTLILRPDKTGHTVKQN